MVNNLTYLIDEKPWILPRWSAYVVDGKVKAVQGDVEGDPSGFKVSGAEHILE